MSLLNWKNINKFFFIDNISKKKWKVYLIFFGGCLLDIFCLKVNFKKYYILLYDF